MQIIKLEFERGREACASDIAGGTLQLYYQTRSAWGERMTELFADRFGVAVVHTSDLTTSSRISYRNGYNDQIKRQIDETHGDGSYAAAMKEVRLFRINHYKENLRDS